MGKKNKQKAPPHLREISYLEEYHPNFLVRWWRRICRKEKREILEKNKRGK